MAEQSSVRLENRSAHVKYLNLGGNAEVITVPPTEDGKPGVTVRFETADERTAFERVLQTPTVRKWVEDGELIVRNGGADRAAATAGADGDTQPPEGGEGARATAAAAHPESSEGTRATAAAAHPESSEGTRTGHRTKRDKE